MYKLKCYLLVLLIITFPPGDLKRQYLPGYLFVAVGYGPKDLNYLSSIFLARPDACAKHFDTTKNKNKKGTEPKRQLGAFRSE